jgi:hypothetical protein
MHEPQVCLIAPAALVEVVDTVGYRMKSPPVAGFASAVSLEPEKVVDYS